MNVRLLIAILFVSIVSGQFVTLNIDGVVFPPANVDVFDNVTWAVDVNNTASTYFAGSATPCPGTVSPWCLDSCCTVSGNNCQGVNSISTIVSIEVENVNLFQLRSVIVRRALVNSTVTCDTIGNRYVCPIGTLNRGAIARVFASFFVSDYRPTIRPNWTVSNNDSFTSACNSGQSFSQRFYSPNSVRTLQTSVTVNCHLQNIGGNCTCPAGQGLNTQVGSGCRACNVAQEYSTGAACVQCPAGTTAFTNRTGCQACPLGQVRASNGASCQSCPAGLVPRLNQTVCGNCDPGFEPFSNSTGCQPCDNRTEISVDGASCTACPTDQRPALDGSQVCEPFTQELATSQAVALAGVLGGVFGAVFLLGVVIIVLIAFSRLRRRKQAESRYVGGAANRAISLQSTSGAAVQSQSSMMPPPANDDNWEVNFNEIRLGDVLVATDSGPIYHAAWRAQEVQVKMLTGTVTVSEVDGFRRETELMKKMRPHKNVIKLLGVITNDPKHYCIITEHLPNGTVENYIKTGKPLEDKMVIQIASDVCAGMLHLHAEGIVHRDLATRNLHFDANWVVKVAGFATARAVSTEGANQTSQTKTDSGPLKWMAPECIQLLQYSPKSDVWSFGITLIEILVRGEPYPGMIPVNAAMAVLQQGYRHPIPPHCPPGLVPLIQSCWATEPSQRPTFDSLFSSIVRFK